MFEGQQEEGSSKPSGFESMFDRLLKPTNVSNHEIHISRYDTNPTHGVFYQTRPNHRDSEEWKLRNVEYVRRWAGSDRIFGSNRASLKSIRDITDMC